MASTDLITYLNYMSTWDTESDENIDRLISEHNLFVNLDDFESDSVVDREFRTLNDLACAVRDTTIAADAIQMAADVAAVASIWSFGFGMAAFAALEAAEQIDRAFISSKSKELNQKLTTVDTDISSQINDNVNNYVIKYKENNNLIASKAPKGLDTRTCRSNLLQFMAQVEIKSKTLDAATFRKYAESARIVYNSDEINKVYDALDTLNFSAKTDADVGEFMNVLVGLKLPDNAQLGLTLVRGFSIAIMAYKLNIANKTIKVQADAAGIPVEEVEASAFKTMDAVGKFVAVVAVVMSVVDVVLDIIDIVDVVEQCKKMCDELNTTIKENYKSYFNGIKTAAQQYKSAISGKPLPEKPNSNGEIYTTDGSGNLSLLKGHSGWRKTWRLIVPGNFGGNDSTDLLFYDPTVGEGEIYTTDGSGNLSLLKRYSGLVKTWQFIVPGNFGGNGATDLLFYDPTVGAGQTYTIDGSGNLSLLKSYSGWRKTWQLIVPGNFGGNDATDLLFYDPTVGEGEIYTTDGSGNLSLLKSYSGWRKTWQLIVPGDFGGNGATDLLFYDPTVGEGEIYTTDGSGNLSLLKRYSGLVKTWQFIVPGDFGGNGATDLLFYDPTVGAGQTYTTDGSGNLSLLKSYSGWHKTWQLIVPGNFGGNGATDLLFYDPTV